MNFSAPVSDLVKVVTAPNRLSGSDTVPVCAETSYVIAQPSGLVVNTLLLQCVVCHIIPVPSIVVFAKVAVAHGSAGVLGTVDLHWHILGYPGTGSEMPKEAAVHVYAPVVVWSADQVLKATLPNLTIP